MASIRTVDVIRRVRDIVLDPDPGEVWDDEELVGWINEAQVVTANALPHLMERYDTMKNLRVQALQTIPDEWDRLLGVVANTPARGGDRIKLTNIRDMDHIRESWPTETVKANMPFEYYMTDPASPRNFYLVPIPAATSDSVYVRYAATPRKLIYDKDVSSTLTEVLSLPDHVINCVLDYTLSRVYSKTGVFDDGREKSTLYHQRFLMCVGKAGQIDSLFHPNMLMRAGGISYRMPRR